jgi:large subunit ribosomal protein L17
MFRNMVTSLFKYEKIQTTGTKAKELRRWAEHLITLAKQGDLHARRQALAIVREKDVVHKLFEQAAERFGSVSGGYTRIIKLGHRPGDAAPVSLVELIYSQDTKKKKAKKKKAKAKSTAETTSQKKTGGGEEKEKSVTKPAPKKKPAANDEAGEAEKEDKPQKAAKGPTPKEAESAKKEDATDTKEKKVPAEKASTDDK